MIYIGSQITQEITYFLLPVHFCHMNWQFKKRRRLDVPKTFTPNYMWRHLKYKVTRFNPFQLIKFSVFSTRSLKKFAQHLFWFSNTKLFTPPHVKSAHILLKLFIFLDHCCCWQYEQRQQIFSFWHHYYRLRK